MAALRVTVSCPGRGATCNVAAQRPGPKFTQRSPTHGPRLSSASPRRTMLCVAGEALRCVRGTRTERGSRYISSRPSSNGSSPPARFFFFERCQTTPGKPFSGTSGSPV